MVSFCFVLNAHEFINGVAYAIENWRLSTLQIVTKGCIREEAFEILHFQKAYFTPISSFDSCITETCPCGSAAFMIYLTWILKKKNQKVNIIDTTLITSINTGLPATSSSASFILSLRGNWKSIKQKVLIKNLPQVAVSGF